MLSPKPFPSHNIQNNVLMTVVDLIPKQSSDLPLSIDSGSKRSLRFSYLYFMLYFTAFPFHIAVEVNAF